MLVEQRRLDGDPAALAAEIRALAPPPPDVREDVAAILQQVRAEGDRAVLDLTRRFDAGGAEPPPLRVEIGELAPLEPSLLDALTAARENVAAVARAQVDEGERIVTLPQGQAITLREAPVRSAAVHVPGGRAPYASTAVMGVTAARVAGVERVVVCTPPSSRDGAVLGAAAMCGADEVYRMGGAQAIGALAYGTESVQAVDVIVGPGNAYVTEAKRQVFGRVGIDALAGPSELVVVTTDAESASLVALDLAGQAEHGEGSLVVAISPGRPTLDALGELIGVEGSVPCVLVEAPDLASALALADALSPEHLQLVGEQAEEAAVGRIAGCIFVGAASATAFGDYVAGSNHVLPTGGTARFDSALSPRAFRRSVAEVRIGARAATALAPSGAAIARAEGFAVHAQSMEARMGENPGP
ncbi:MAG: histidinol dehydrogenase [Solirubrobacteraceae bacterium]